MTNTQFYLALGLPCSTLALMSIVTTVSNRAGISDLRSDMRAGFVGLGSRIDRVEKRLDGMDPEIRINHDHRLALLEARILGHVK